LTRFRGWYWLLLVVALFAIAALAVARGAVSVPLEAVFDALRGRGDPTVIAIVRDLRLPRVMLGALVGAGLGASGAALQGSLRNPLAEPYLLGVSGGAAVGAVIVFALGFTADFGSRSCAISDCRAWCSAPSLGRGSEQAARPSRDPCGIHSPSLICLAYRAELRWEQ